MLPQLHCIAMAASGITPVVHGVSCVTTGVRYTLLAVFDDE